MFRGQMAGNSDFLRLYSPFIMENVMCTKKGNLRDAEPRDRKPVALAVISALKEKWFWVISVVFFGCKISLNHVVTEASLLMTIFCKIDEDISKISSSIKIFRCSPWYCKFFFNGTVGVLVEIKFIKKEIDRFGPFIAGNDRPIHCNC